MRSNLYSLCRKLILRLGFVKGVIVPSLGFFLPQPLVSKHSLLLFSPTSLSTTVLVSSSFLEHSFHAERLCIYQEVSSVWKPLPSTFNFSGGSSFSCMAQVCLNITALRNHAQPQTSNTSSTHPATVLIPGGNYCVLYLLKEMGIPDHLTCLVRNLYAGQEATELDMEQQTGSK